MTYLRRFQPMSLEELLPLVLGPYERQQERVLAEFGGDPNEIKRRVMRMRDWAEFCMRESRTLQREAICNELFGPAEPPKVEPIPGHRCELCHGAGMYWSDGCTPRRRNPGNLSVPGFVVCRCAAGTVQNRAIALHGRNAGKAPTRRGVQAEEW